MLITKCNGYKQWTSFSCVHRLLPIAKVCFDVYWLDLLSHNPPNNCTYRDILLYRLCTRLLGIETALENIGPVVILCPLTDSCPHGLMAAVQCVCVWDASPVVLLQHREPCSFLPQGLIPPAVSHCPAALPPWVSSPALLSASVDPLESFGSLHWLSEVLYCLQNIYDCLLPYTHTKSCSQNVHNCLLTTSPSILRVPITQLCLPGF